MSETLGRKVTRGLAWSGLESFGGAALSLATTMVLARLVLPDEYGLIAELQIFILFGTYLVESGLSTALIRLKERTKRHEETALAFNIAIGVLIYFVIYLAAPWIASFYGMGQLCEISRIYGLIIPLNSLCVVQHARLSAAMQFGMIFAATGTATVLSSLVAIIMAWKGEGVWALVAQQLIMWGARGAILWGIQWNNPVAPRFHGKEFRELYAFGYKLLLSSFIVNLSTSFSSMIIGKVFTAGQAGLFSRARTIASYPAENGTAAVQRVSFPAMVGIAEDKAALETTTRRFIGFSSWILFPVMILLAALAPQCVEILLGSEWAESAPYFAIICLGYTLYPLHSINLNLLNVFGRSDLFLRLEIIKAVVSISLLVTGLVLGGVMGICVAFSVNSVVCIFINGHYSEKYSGIKIWTQVWMLLPSLLISIPSAVLAYWVASLVNATFLSLVTGLTAGGAIYLIISKILIPDYIGMLGRALNNLKS